MQTIHDLLSALESGSDEQAEAAVTRFAALPPVQYPQLLDSLQELLAAPDAGQRWWALRAAAAISDERTPQLLLYGLQDLDPAVRQCAALGLRLHPRAQSVPALLSALQDQDALTARLAADALSAIGAEAAPALIDVLQQGSPAARRLAARSLAAIGDHRSIPALFEALDDDSLLIEYWANEGLERMGVGMSFFIPDG